MTEFYEAWGPVESVSFAEWWPKHWRTIFGVDVGVRVVSKVEAQDLDEGVLCVVHVSELADKFVKNPRAKISFRLRTGNSNVVFTPVRTVDAVAAIRILNSSCLAGTENRTEWLCELGPAGGIIASVGAIGLMKGTLRNMPPMWGR